MSDEISIREIFETIFKGKYIIIGITIAALILATVYNKANAVTVYEAKAVVAINQPATPKSTGESLEAMVETLSRTPQINTQSIAAHAKMPIVLFAVMQKAGFNPSTQSYEEFANNISILPIKGTELIEIVVINSDPKMAAEIANNLAEEFSSYVSVMYKNRTEKALSFLNTQVNEEQQKLDASADKMKEFLKLPISVEQINEEITNSFQLLGLLNEKLVEYQVKASGLVAGIKAAEGIMQTLDSKIELRKSIVDDPIVFNQYRDIKGDVSSSLEVKSEEINPIYVELRKELELDKTKLALMNNQSIEVEKQIARTNKRIYELQLQLADMKSEYEQLQTDYDILKDNYILLNKEYTDARISESVKIGEATIVTLSPAMIPDHPVVHILKYKVTMTTAVAFILSIMMVLLLSSWRYSKEDTLHSGAIKR